MHHDHTHPPPPAPPSQPNTAPASADAADPEHTILSGAEQLTPQHYRAAENALAVVRTGKFSSFKRLAEGGGGVVWTARDLSLRRELAVKTLRTPDPAMRVRFIDEAQITAQLQHPNIVPVHELAVDDQGAPMIVMKRVHGTTLRAAIGEAHARADGGPLAEAEQRALLGALLKVCDAIAFAHSRRILHRDLKPDNVMVGDFGEVLVMDWGLAKPIGSLDEFFQTGRRDVISDRRLAEIEVTMQGMVSGTLQYMPPEQAAGRADRLDETADIYALGAILYTMLTNTAPYTVQSRKLMIAAVIAGALVPPSERAPDKAVPPELEAVVLKAMHRSRRLRYRSVSEFRSEIEAYLAGRALAAADYSPWSLLAKFAKRNRMAVIGTATTLAAALIGIIAVVWVVATAEASQLRAEQTARVEAEQRAHDVAVETATGFHAQSEDLLAAARDVEFNPASPSAYYQAWLPVCLRMGQAIQAHPDAPERWRRELAEHCATIQELAQSIGDWGMAQHIAESTHAWNAIDDAAAGARLQQVSAARQAAEQADVDRLAEVLRAIADAEDRPGDNGAAAPRALNHGEVQERARRVAATVRGRTAFMVRAVIGALRDDPAALQRLELPESVRDPDAHVRRLLLIDLLGRLGDATTAADGATAADLMVAALRTHYAPGDEDEMIAWLLAAARLQSALRVAPGGAAARSPLQRALDEALRAWQPQIALTVETAQALLALANGDLRLPRAEPDELDSEAYAVSIDAIADWAVSTARSGSAYTAALLRALDRDATPDGEALRLRQRVFVIGQIGRYGDVRSPTPGAPTPGERLTADLAAIPTTELVDEASLDSRRRAIALIVALSRLDHREAGALIADARRSSREFSWVWVHTWLAFRLLPEPVDRGEPTDALGHSARGHLRTARGDYAGALQDHLRAIELDPDEGRHWANAGNALSDLVQPEEALRYYLRAIELSPREPMVHYNCGNVYRDLGQLNEALACYNTALDLQPSMVPAYIQRGVTRRRLNDLDGAVADYERAIDLDPHNAAPYNHRAVIRRQRGDLAHALADANQAIRLDPRLAGAYINRGNIHHSLGNPNDAIDDYTRAIQLNPTYANAYLNRGGVRAEVGDSAGALADCDRAIALDPTLWEAYLNRAAVTQRSDVAATLQALQQAYRYCPTEAERRVIAGHITRLGGRVPD